MTFQASQPRVVSSFTCRCFNTCSSPLMS
jgi:hypothetical protein